MAMELSEFLAIINKADTNELQYCRSLIESRLTRSLRVGDAVRFDAGNRGTIFGMVVKINAKSVGVKANNGINWKVAPCYITKI